jgi:hypothetical protein
MLSTKEFDLEKAILFLDDGIERVAKMFYLKMRITGSVREFKQDYSN